MPSTSGAYRAAIRLGMAVAPALGLLRPRIRAGLRARSAAGERLLDWSRSHRDPSRPLVWFHAASVGEGRQAESVLLALRRRCPECQIVYTHFSPSAEALAEGIPSDASDYLPYDLPENVDRLLQTLQPDLLVFAKLDVWPELSTRAAGGGADLALIAATVSPGSSRLRWLARRLLGPGYRAITVAAAIAPDDAFRLERLGVALERIQVLGDPRFDSVVARVKAVAPDDPLLRLGGGAPTLVAGSTWPEDEAVLLRAFARIFRERPDAKLILVPHEPTAAHLARVERNTRSVGLPSPVRLGSATERDSIVLGDRVGVLAVLYGAGTMAYVGGGFGRAGLHSVLEPAAWGLPVVFGPHWQNSRDAGLLLHAGAARALAHERLGPAAQALHDQWQDWIRDEATRETQGAKALEVVNSGMGASEQTADLLAQLISRQRPRKLRSWAPTDLQSKS
ncbi:MAG TPA: glycosyltransferase N-terminal domain-containing protein [Gemmatimonadales bacterium]|nr:glycosyltransferase N-terminal domain-containing protein [Gemmatimonadales bacterium]